jgi:hypothetical protein
MTPLAGPSLDLFVASVFAGARRTIGRLRGRRV